MYTNMVQLINTNVFKTWWVSLLTKKTLLTAGFNHINAKSEQRSLKFYRVYLKIRLLEKR